MKRLTIITGILFGLLLLLSVSQQAHAQKKIDNPDITVGVDGMVCPFCAYGVTKRLKKLEEVEAVYVNVDKGTADLKLKKGFTLSEKRIKETVDKAGFEVRSIEYHNKAAKPKEEETSS